MDTLEFVNTVNKLRLANKGRFYRLTGTVNGSKFKIAGLGTHLFSFYLEDVDMASPNNLKVSEYKEHLSYWSNYFVRLNKRNNY